ncbi:MULTISPECIES: YceI family protein [Aliarcobacter]|uniref:YceI family protein n=1 Tax=Arcobacter sp. AZ-2023 TaxID=3074453 RepID=A0AA96IFD5_9BACT|nr:YceI family protein [Aliarcobacter cryaerophilus]WNL29973.1 YceI family protein [Arcobacter sp. AZ-2023]MCT7444405.1 YceI family protein [Aliarcobacter cryaerophilus]MCT7465735.1 YceI family protein [Aliarcobacter cryaerophilus]MCT7479155.1 YceI family protein [Aliarcobacter cryaerophilus]MCT7498408.1 YceI family protein [Aliarcobacter cryaerophilus]
MKTTKILLSILLLTPFLYAKEFVVNSKNSKANFQLTYQKTNIVDGSFQDISGLIIFDEKENIIKSIKGSVDTDSVSTQNGELTSLIISEKILNSKKYPEIEFIAEKISDDKVFGDITINGVKRSVEFDIENSGIFLDKLYVTMSTTLKRSSFDLFWDVLENFGSSAVSNDIKVSIDIEATLQNDLIFQHAKEKTKK